MDRPTPTPPKEGISVTALALAVLVHALLAGALFLGVQWKSRTPSAASVELWQSAPAPLASRPKPLPLPLPPLPPPPPLPEPKPLPPPPPPSPPPLPKPSVEAPDPDIAIKARQEKERLERLEKERQEALEKERQEKERLERLEKERQERQEKERREKERKEALRQQAGREAERQKAMQDMLAGADAEIKQRQAQQAAAAHERAQNAYIGKIRGKIKGNIVLPHVIEGNPEAIFRVRQLPSGEIIEVKITQSSGNKALDEAIERAIRKSDPLPLPDSSSLFERVLELKYKPFDE